MTGGESISTLRGSAVTLRPLERRHLEKTRAWANDPELMRLLDRARPVSEAEHEEWFARIGERADCAYFAIETRDGGAHVGNVWLWDIDARHRRAELRIVIGERAHTGRGAGTEAINALCGYAFGHLNLHRVYAYVLAFNPRARRAFEKAGFILEGTLREDRRADEGYTDVYLLGKLNSFGEA
jgi:RimJ/RimL family protein N-acetyltransferase